MGLALGKNLKFCSSVVKGLKVKVRKFWEPNSKFVEVTRKKLVGGGEGLFAPALTPILSRVKPEKSPKFKTFELNSYFYL